MTAGQIFIGRNPADSAFVQAEFNRNIFEVQRLHILDASVKKIPLKINYALCHPVYRPVSLVKAF